MNLTELSNALTRVYNKLGNRYITRNFISEPFEFKVKVRYGDPYEYHEYYAEIYSIPDMPEYFKYIPKIRKEKNTYAAGVDVDVIGIEFKNMIEYVDTERRGQIGVNFMNVKK